jgi:phosphomannomutase
MTVSNRFIFDVDGTLTPSRQKINADFQRWFLEFTYSNYVYLVTGSDYEKTVEQLGNTICENVERVYNCSGSDVYEGGNSVRTSEWEVPPALQDLMFGWLQGSRFPIRTGNHMEERPGMVNFSIVGRNCTAVQRKEYVEYDKANRERETIAGIINSVFDDITATVGGETGIDIHPTGADKSQILKDFDPENDILQFFGDAMFKGGNDYPLKKQIIDNDLGFCYNIKDYKETWKILKDEFSI